MHISTKNASVTLTFEIRAWFFCATHHLDMANTSAKLYGNPFIQYKVMARTKKTWTNTQQMDRQTDGRCDFNSKKKPKKQEGQVALGCSPESQRQV